MAGGSKTSTVINDPWKDMPDWLQKAYQQDARFREQELLKPGTDVADKLAANPRTVLGPSKSEYAGIDYAMDGLRDAASYGDKAVRSGRNLSGLESDYLDPAKRLVGQASTFTDRASGMVPGAKGSIMDSQAILDATGRSSQDAKYFAKDRRLSNLAEGAATNDEASRAAMEAAGFDIDALRSKYETGYTGDVVDTTLSNMQRQADREALARESKNASIGGTSNSRTAVGHAVADQLTGMNMAQVEAELRDKGYTRGIEGAFGEAGLELERGGFLDSLAGRELDRASVLDKLAQTGLDRGALLDRITNTDISRSGAQNDITNSRLDVGAFIDSLGKSKGDQALILKALADSGLDIGRTQSGIYADAADRTAANGLKGAGVLAGIGEVERGLSQERLDERRTAEQQSLGWLADLFSGTQYTKGPNPTTQTSTTPGPSLGQTLLGTGTALAGAFISSDERVKEDVDVIDGGLDAIRKLKPSTYRYKEGHGHTPDRTSGLMAQDIESAGIVGAVREFDGVKHVDPYPVLATIVRAVQELDERTAA